MANASGGTGSHVTSWQPSRVDLSLLAIVVVAVSTSGLAVTAATAPALAIAFWRCALGATATAPVALAGHNWSAFTHQTLKRSLLAGVVLGIHFAGWVPSVRFTTVATAVALVSTQPIFSALLASAQGTHVPRQVWFGIATAMVGVLVVVGLDFHTGTRALMGDAMALLGAATMAVYLTIGSHVRQTVPTSTYTTVVYGIAALTIAIICMGFNTPLVGFDRTSWLLIGAVTLGPQLLGHSLMNRIVHSTSPTVIGVAVLLEIPIAAILAALWFDQSVGLSIATGIGFILLGLALVATARSRPDTVAIDQ